MPTTIVNYGNVSLLPQSATIEPTKPVQIPHDTFLTQRNDDVSTLAGLNWLSSAFKVALTDRFEKTIGSTPYVFNTVDLGQTMPTHDDNGVAIDNAPDKLLL